MKAGRKPNLTFSEQVKLRSIQAAFGAKTRGGAVLGAGENVRETAQGHQAASA